MKRSLRVRLILGFAAWVALVAGAFAQEPEKSSEKPESFAEKHELQLKWANFLILAGALGYLIGKHAGPFFAARSGSIRKDMVESEQQRQAAEAQAAEVDRRLANLEKEIAALRGESQAGAQAEIERLAQHTAAEIAKIQAHAEQEIASAGKAARTELKRYSAQLAVELAEQKIRARMTPQTQDALVRGFVRDLK
jgi:F-type H+-transporting ATPase subunit b